MRILSQLRFLSLILLLLIFSSCMPEQSEKKREGACSEDQAFDAKTRACYNIKITPLPPENKLKVVDIVEDIPQTIELTYLDNQNDYASFCTVSIISAGISVSSPCVCVGGYCSISLSPSANFNGISDFSYSVMDQNGWSTPTIVRVNVAAVDDAPVATGTTPASTIIFTEDATQAITLNYSDVESGKATACETTLNSSNAYVSAACSCTVAGVCTFSLSGRTDKTTVGTESFTYRVKVDGVWSAVLAVNYQISGVDDLPIASTTVTRTIPSPILEDTPFTVTLPYYDGDIETPNTCRIVPGSASNVEENAACVCAAVDANGNGTCTMSLTIPAASINLNKNTGSTFSFKYEFLDEEIAEGYGADSETVTLVVEPVNDDATTTNPPSATYPVGSPYAATEDTAATIDTSFTIDEGGGTDENAQTISIKVTSSNQTILPDSSIVIKYGGTSIGVGGAFRGLTDSTASANASNITFVLTPAAEQTGTVILTVTFIDSEPVSAPATSPFTFYVTFAPGADRPTMRILQKVCNYDSYAYAPTCGTQGCFSYQGPQSAGIIPDRYGQIFLDYYSDLCYYSTNTVAATNWSILPTACPITKSVVETGCAIASLNNPLNCISSASPVGVVTPVQVGSYFYDTTSDKCYVSTTAGSSSGWSEVTLTPSLDVCNYNQSGTGSPLAVVGPTSTTSIYKDTSAGTCYLAQTTSSSSWVSLSSSCPISSKTTETNCKFTNCLGAIPPRGNSPGSLDVTPTGTGRYYYNYTDGICYKSVSTNNGIKNWVIYGTDFSDPQGNERGPIILKNIYLDEGGDSSEDTEGLTVTIQNLTSFTNASYPGNANLLGLTGIKAFKNGTELTPTFPGDHKVEFALGDGTADAKLSQLKLYFLPKGGENPGYGRTELKMSIFDGTNTTNKYFSLLVFPVGSTHLGWDKLVALGSKVDKFSNILYEAKTSVKLAWPAFNLHGDVDVANPSPIVDPARSDYSAVSVQGYNIYRRMAGQMFDYSRPLNGTTLINKTTREFTDTEGKTSTIPGAPLPGTVYYYRVLPVDSFNSSIIRPDESFSSIRVIAPPNNMSFAHRWMMNKEICEKLKGTPDKKQNYRCAYSGVGEYLPGAAGTISYFDVRNDLLIDQFEAGCPYTSDTSTSSRCSGSCLGQDTPSLISDFTPANDDMYYNRATGECFEYTGAAWDTFHVRANAGTLTAAQAVQTQLANLPPLVWVNQNDANKICEGRSFLTITSSSTTPATNPSAVFSLPSRKEQIAYSAWSSGTGFSDFEIDTLETGLSLNASAKCNASRASGLETGYTDSDEPVFANLYSLPGTESSTIRSMISGTSRTNKCVSRYGVQDSIGNVKEWVKDRLYCHNSYTCRGVYNLAAGASTPVVPCRYTTRAEVTSSSWGSSNTCGIYGCIGTQSPTAAGIVAGAAGVLFLDSTTNKCYISVNAGSAADWREIYASTATTEYRTTCPISPTTSEPACTREVMGGGGINCTELAAPTTTASFLPTKAGSYYFQRSLEAGNTTGACFVSKLNAAQTAYEWTSTTFYNGYTAGTHYITPPSILTTLSTTSTTDMKVDDTYFFNYALDGLKGPCIDANANGVCDDTALTGWALSNEPYKAGHFFFPLGLPVHNDFKINYSASTIISSLLEIGPSAGITANALHNDYFSVNSSAIIAEDANHCGAMSTGGSYLSGGKAGRYTAEFYPCDDANVGSDADGNGSGIDDDDRAKDIGFRCVISIPWIDGADQIYRTEQTSTESL